MPTLLKNQLSHTFFVFPSLTSDLILVLSLCLLAQLWFWFLPLCLFGLLMALVFSNTFPCTIKLVEKYLPNIFMYMHGAISFLLSTAFIMHMLICSVFISEVQFYELKTLSFHSTLIQWCVVHFVYFLWFLLLKSSFISQWPEKMQDVISIFQYLLKLVLYPTMWFILEKVPWAAKPLKLGRICIL